MLLITLVIVSAWLLAVALAVGCCMAAARGDRALAASALDASTLHRDATLRARSLAAKRAGRRTRHIA